jgi:N-acetylmuramoyl-L-alanine amidase
LAPAPPRRQTAGVTVYRRGDRGPEITDIQQRLAELGYLPTPEHASGAFDETMDQAVRAFQGQRSLRVDGVVGPDTWNQLVEAGYRLGDRTLYLHAPMLRGDDVRALQRKLDALGFDIGKQDGFFGPATDAAVREFQRNVGDPVDGVVGLHTIASIERMRPLEDAPGRVIVRETEQLRAIHGKLRGRVVAIDPGHDEAGADARVEQALAGALAAELRRLGAAPEILVGEPATTNASARAGMANDLDAAICVSLHLGGAAPESTGPTCSYFGSQTTYSPAGRHLAELILGELEHELQVRGRLQRLAATLLRETQMPAVQVEALVAANEVEAAMLRAPDAITRIGRAIAEGVRRFFED